MNIPRRLSRGPRRDRALQRAVPTRLREDLKANSPWGNSSPGYIRHERSQESGGDCTGSRAYDAIRNQASACIVSMPALYGAYARAQSPCAGGVHPNGRWACPVIGVSIFANHRRNNLRTDRVRVLPNSGDQGADEAIAFAFWASRESCVRLRCYRFRPQPDIAHRPRKWPLEAAAYPCGSRMCVAAAPSLERGGHCCANR